MKHADFVLPDLTGKVIFITGGTAGMGAVAAKLCADQHPAHIYISGRNAARADQVAQEIASKRPNVKVSLVDMDLASLDSVDSAMKRVISEERRMDILLCNAGIMAVPPELSKDGYEIQFQTNHLGHALVVKHLLPLLLSTAQAHGDARVVSLTSVGFQLAPSQGIIFEDLKTIQDYSRFSGWTRYGQSKLANILYVAELARRYPQLTTAAAHPGVVRTGLVDNLGFWNRLFINVTTYHEQTTPEKGALNALWAATTAKDGIESGAFYEPVGEPGRTSKQSKDGELASKLWTWTEEALAKY